jgi:hypothetical protein
MKDAIFWDTKPCCSCKIRRFGGTRFLQQPHGITPQKIFAWAQFRMSHLSLQFVVAIICDIFNSIQFKLILKPIGPLPVSFTLKGFIYIKHSYVLKILADKSKFSTDLFRYALRWPRNSLYPEKSSLTSPAALSVLFACGLKTAEFVCYYMPSRSFLNVLLFNTSLAQLFYLGILFSNILNLLNLPFFGI